MKTLALTIGLFAALFTFAGTKAQAQDMPYRISDKEVKDLLARMKTDADRFRRSLRTALNDSHFNGTRREDQINDFVKAFDKETDRLKDRFNHHKSVAADVQSVLDRAVRIDRFMKNHPELSDGSHRDWAAVRNDLDELARAYNVTYDWNVVITY
jgi:hypothetical protein